MSSSQNEENPDKQPDHLVDTLEANLSGLDLGTEEELQRQIVSEATRDTNTGSNISRGGRIVPDETRVLSTSTSPEDARNHFSRHVRDTVATNTSSSEEETFPAFLGDAQVLETLRRAGDLFQQRHGLNGTTPFAPPSSDWARFRALYGVPPRETFLEPDFSSTSVAPPVSTRVVSRGYVDSSYALSGNGVHAKFTAGNESSSVLQLTKRPKLRTKDLAHRQSLGSGAPDVPQPISTDKGKILLMHKLNSII
jgi:hypothetical protein